MCDARAVRAARVARRAAVAIDRPPVHDTTYDAIFVPDDEYLSEDDDDESD